MSQLHALIIDDNVKNLSILAHLLAEQNVETTQVTNAKILHPVLEELMGLHVIFVDLEMPGISGFDVLKQLKSDPRFQQVPVIAYTVHISEIHKAHEYGFDGFIGKPLDADKFPGQLARILNGEGVWETA